MPVKTELERPRGLDMSKLSVSDCFMRPVIAMLVVVQSSARSTVGVEKRLEKKPLSDMTLWKRSSIAGIDDVGLLALSNLQSEMYVYV